MWLLLVCRACECVIFQSQLKPNDLMTWLRLAQLYFFIVCASSLGINSLETATKAFYDHDLLKFPFKISIFYSFGFNYLFIFLMKIEITLYIIQIYFTKFCFQFWLELQWSSDIISYAIFISCIQYIYAQKHFVDKIISQPLTI